MAQIESLPSLQHAAHFLENLAGSPRTADTYRHALKRLAACLQEVSYGGLDGTTSPYPSEKLADDVLVVFYDWLTRVRGYQPRTVSLYLAAVRRFLVWLDAHDYLAPGFSVAKAQNRLKAVQGKVHRPSDVAQPVDPALPRVVTYYDQLPLPPRGPKNRLARLRLLRNRAIVHTLYASAGRVSEVAGLTRSQVLDGRQDEILITGKGGRQRVILLTPEAQTAVGVYCAERSDHLPGLFVSHGRRQGKPLRRWMLWKVVKDAAKALGLYEGTSPHDFRHYRARQLLHEGMDLDVLQFYLGHADIATTRRIYAPHTAVAKVKDQLATFGHSPSEAERSAPP